jgi:hypothetical protein
VVEDVEVVVDDVEVVVDDVSVVVEVVVALESSGIVSFCSTDNKLISL